MFLGLIITGGEVISAGAQAVIVTATSAKIGRYFTDVPLNEPKWNDSSNIVTQIKALDILALHTGIANAPAFAFGLLGDLESMFVLSIAAQGAFG